MNIAQAREEILNTARIYLAKDEFGAYRIPLERQRPVFMLGAPGIGKTAIMEQVARELGIGLVSYSMTHHTRQSALGLPYIETREFDGTQYRVSEYTMSEIIAAVHEEMRATGVREGILFLDEINCVSETLTPAILQFLQYKEFGRHRVPDGWVVVTAGNPAEYNRSTHDFDVATWDRLKRLDVEPDYAAWRAYAVGHGVHPAVVSYLDVEESDFYHVETTLDGKSFVTARGWDDLSRAMIAYEEQGIAVTGRLISQYVQDERIAAKFSAYYDLFNTYRASYEMDAILAGQAGEGVQTRAKAAAFDERVACVELLTSALVRLAGTVMRKDAAAEEVHAILAALLSDAARRADDPQGAGENEGTHAGVGVGEYEGGSECRLDLRLACAQAAGDVSQRISAARLHRTLGSQALGALEEAKAFLLELATGSAEAGAQRGQQANASGAAYQDAAAEANAAESLCAAADGGACDVTPEYVKAKFAQFVSELEQQATSLQEALENAYAFMDTAWGTGRETLLFTTDISADASMVAFLTRYGSPAYISHSEALMFEERGATLRQRAQAFAGNNAH